MSNRLASESSPYLLQHQNNPVDWYPWGAEALERAQREDRPIFLSIGYSACHWCHVMEHESFENAAIAQLMNEHYVCIKVDREERPDLDQIYMNAVQMMTGRGGWPMSVFLTPALEPFYGGTYWPPEPRMGMPGFGQILQGVHDAWVNRRSQALEGAATLTAQLREISAAATGEGELDDATMQEILHGAARHLRQHFDGRHGGFGGAPKFPHPMDLQVLLRVWRRERRDDLLAMVRLTLDKMAGGGIYDHLGGGFARYSVDDRWLVPHFEKMLYDNALLSAAYLEAFLATKEPRYAQVARETFDYVLRDMTDPAGGFYSTEDADSEGEEGKYYIWTPVEVAEVLGPQRAETFCYVYDVTEPGNFEERNILNLPKPIETCAKILNRTVEDLSAELAAGRAELLAVRERRVRPGRDDKVLTSWNGLMIDSLARAAAALDDDRYCAAARAAADFLLRELRRDDGRLWHTWRHGKAKLDAYLDDYAAAVNGLVSVYEATFDERYLTAAAELADSLLDLFADPAGGACFFTARDHEALITRVKDLYDSSVPSGNALAATGLLRLAALTGNERYRAAAAGILAAAAALMERSPTAAGQMLLALDFQIGPVYEIALVGDPASDAMRAALADLRSRFIPNRVVALRSAGDPAPLLAPLFAGKGDSDEPTAYVCQQFACQAPAIGRDAILAAWQRLEES